MPSLNTNPEVALIKKKSGNKRLSPASSVIVWIAFLSLGGVVKFSRMKKRWVVGG